MALPVKAPADVPSAPPSKIKTIDAIAEVSSKNQMTAAAASAPTTKPTMPETAAAFLSALSKSSCRIVTPAFFEPQTAHE